MADELEKYNEPLEVEEIIFLVRKEQKERKQYFRVFSFLMIMSFIIPFAGAWYRAFEGAPNAFSLPRFFVSACVLLTISGAAVWSAYRVNLRKIQADIKSRTKTVECAHVVRKLYMPQNNAYFLYLDSTNKLSIEVQETDYYRLQAGDEVNIEFATHSRLYLGYF
ncbi:MAG: hypothetical protein BGO69_07760 [Bacteroidetes bacterium 46-16]|nr:MAG: hypothetical protein BGO69_07760 [Bacteroidetes bacterium 46-16]